MGEQLKQSIKVYSEIPPEMVILAIKIIDVKHQVSSYKEYVPLIEKEFNCKCNIDDVMNSFTYSMAMEDYISHRKILGYWD
jgi:hypothetical protein|tara:strand:+ start:1315 stop:1557 length:243 start_codon:yes stop_codon:yes gene_type:complete